MGAPRLFRSAILEISTACNSATRKIKADESLVRVHCACLSNRLSHHAERTSCAGLSCVWVCLGCCPCLLGALCGGADLSCSLGALCCACVVAEPERADQAAAAEAVAAAVPSAGARHPDSPAGRRQRRPPPVNQHTNDLNGCAVIDTPRPLPLAASPTSLPLNQPWRCVDVLPRPLQSLPSLSYSSRFCLCINRTVKQRAQIGF